MEDCVGLRCGRGVRRARLAELHGLDMLLQRLRELLPAEHHRERLGIGHGVDIGLEERVFQLFRESCSVGATRRQDAHGDEDLAHGRAAVRTRLRAVQPGEEVPSRLLLRGGRLRIDDGHPRIGDRVRLVAVRSDGDGRGGDVSELVAHAGLERALPPVGHDDHAGFARHEIVEERAGCVRVSGPHRGIREAFLHELLVEARRFPWRPGCRAGACRR